MQKSGTAPQATVDALAGALRGDVIRPGDDGYEQARRVHNAMIDRRPGAIARCTDVADVITTVRLAREGDALLSVRGGGHNGAGLGVCDGGVVLDLSRMRGVRVDRPAASPG
jgi:FAD/FMN-containing dehydrogenase